MIVALSRSSRKDAVTLTEHPFIPFDNEDDSLLFEKLQEHVLAHYPNPERKGCPDPAVLRNLIDNPSDVTLAELNDPMFIWVVKQQEQSSTVQPAI